MGMKTVLKIGGFAAAALLIVSSGCSKVVGNKASLTAKKLPCPVGRPDCVSVTDPIVDPPPPAVVDPNVECKALLGNRAVCEEVYSPDPRLCAVCALPAAPAIVQPDPIQTQSRAKPSRDWSALLAAIWAPSALASSDPGVYAQHFCAKTFSPPVPAFCPVAHTLVLRDDSGSMEVSSVNAKPIAIRYRNRSGAVTQVGNACVYPRGSASIQGCQNVPTQHALQLVLRVNSIQVNE